MVIILFCSSKFITSAHKKMDAKTTKIPKTDYNLVNQRDVEMIEFRSDAQTSSIMSHEPAASQARRGKCDEEWDCFCFSCDFGCCDC
jgi:hypothetical protein